MTTLRSLLPTPVVVVWVVLVALTLASWSLGHDHGSVAGPLPVRGVGALVLVVAMAKVDLVGRWFMELRLAPRGLRWAFDGWCVGVGVLLVALYLAGS
jgi:hypothetical protein